MPTALRIRPLPSDLGPRAIASAQRPHPDRSGGAQLRCCLRNARPGEPIVLISVTPPGPAGAYAESGPVFVHTDDCSGPADGGYPEDWRCVQQVFRAYDAAGTIVGGTVVEPGAAQEDAAARLFTDPSVAFIQARNVVHGCYLCTIERDGGLPDGQRST
jgi:Protein of unknown function (DUF1203)